MATETCRVVTALGGAIEIDVQYDSGNLAISAIVVSSNGQYTAWYQISDANGRVLTTGTTTLAAGTTTFTIPHGFAFTSDPNQTGDFSPYSLQTRIPA